MHDAAAGGGGSGLNGEIGQAGDDFFEPMKIQVGNCAAESEAEGDAPSEEWERGQECSEAKHKHEFADTVESAGIEVALFGIRFGGIH